MYVIIRLLLYWSSSCYHRHMACEYKWHRWIFPMCPLTPSSMLIVIGSLPLSFPIATPLPPFSFVPPSSIFQKMLFLYLLFTLPSYKYFILYWKIMLMTSIQFISTRSDDIRIYASIRFIPHTYVDIGIFIGMFCMKKTTLCLHINKVIHIMTTIFVIVIRTRVIRFFFLIQCLHVWTEIVCALKFLDR